MREHLLNDAGAIQRLAARLQTSKKVQEFNQRYSEPSKNGEAWTLAHAFTDIEESFSTFLEVLLPRLMNKDLHGEQLEEVLLDIGDEFEHVLYHMKDPKFYAYLFSPEKEKGQRGDRDLSG